MTFLTNNVERTIYVTQQKKTLNLSTKSPLKDQTSILDQSTKYIYIYIHTHTLYFLTQITIIYGVTSNKQSIELKQYHERKHICKIKLIKKLL